MFFFFEKLTLVNLGLSCLPLFYTLPKLTTSFMDVPRAFCLIRNNENVCSNQKKCLKLSDQRHVWILYWTYKTSLLVTFNPKGEQTYVKNVRSELFLFKTLIMNLFIDCQRINNALWYWIFESTVKLGLINFNYLWLFIQFLYLPFNNSSQL